MNLVKLAHIVYVLWTSLTLWYTSSNLQSLEMVKTERFLHPVMFPAVRFRRFRIVADLQNKENT